MIAPNCKSLILKKNPHNTVERYSMCAIYFLDPCQNLISVTSEDTSSLPPKHKEFIFLNIYLYLWNIMRRLFLISNIFKNHTHAQQVILFQTMNSTVTCFHIAVAMLDVCGPCDQWRQINLHSASLYHISLLRHAFL